MQSAALRVESFRGIELVEAELAPITIVVGRNGSGKSSLLEALAAAAAAGSGMRDWRGKDVIMDIVYAKLLGNTAALIHEGSAAATIELRAPGYAASLKLARPGEREIQQLACRIADGISPYSLAGCLREAVATNAYRRGEPLQELVKDFDAYSIAERIVGLLKGLCGGQPAGTALQEEAAVVLEALSRGLRVVVEAAVSEAVHLSATVAVGARRVSLEKTYYYTATHMQSIDYMLTIPRLLDAVREAVRLLSPEEARLLRPSDISHCVMKSLLKARNNIILHEEEPGDAAAEDDAGLLVFTLFRRTLSGVVAPLNRCGPAIMLHDAASRLRAYGASKTFMELAESIPGLDAADITAEFFEPVIASKHGGKMPLSMLGDGALHLLLQFTGLALARRRRTILAYEEPERGLHPDYMAILAAKIVETIQENPGSLIALSTHSAELARSIVNAARQSGAEDSLALVVMENGRAVRVLHGREAANQVTL